MLGLIAGRGRRIGWGVVMVCVSGFMLLHLTMLASDLVANDTSIDVRITEARELNFPAVTVCNANPIKKSALVAEASSNPQLRALLALDANKKRKKRRRKRAPPIAVGKNMSHILELSYVCLATIVNMP